MYFECANSISPYLLPVESGLWEEVLLELSLFSCHGERGHYFYIIISYDFYIKVQKGQKDFLIHTFIQQGCIPLIKCDSIDIYNYKSFIFHINAVKKSFLRTKSE